jgi:Ricin-type beta-trefoil lectin domain
MRRILLAHRRAKTSLTSVLAISVTAAVTPVLQAAIAGPIGFPSEVEPPYVYILHSATKMTVEVFAHRTDNGSPVVLWPHYGGSSQQFSVERKPLTNSYQSLEEQWFLLRARHSNKCLKTAGYQSGARVVQQECGGDASQMWRVRTVSMTAAECPSGRCFASFRHVLENYYDRGRRCLDAANAKFPAPPVKGAGLQAWDCIARFSAPNAVNQQWELVGLWTLDRPNPPPRIN